MFNSTLKKGGALLLFLSVVINRLKYIGTSPQFQTKSSLLTREITRGDDGFKNRESCRPTHPPSGPKRLTIKTGCDDGFRNKER